jgi:WD40 repeat protein
MDGRVNLWSIPRLALHRSLSLDAPVYAVSFGGQWLFAGCEEKIRVFSVPEMQPVHSLLGIEGKVFGLAFDHQRRRLYALTADFKDPLNAAVYVWEVPEGNLAPRFERRLRGFGGLGLSLACDPSGRWLAAGEGCGKPEDPKPSRVIVWDAATLRITRVFYCHAGWVESVAFSPDGRWLVSGDAVGPIGAPKPSSLFVHDVEANRTVLAVDAHLGWVRCLAFANVGGTLLSGGSDGIWVWDFHRLIGWASKSH